MRATRQVACRVCRGPVADGFSRCYQCELHWRRASGWLADAVMPIAYAVKGGQLATDLWRYKDGDHAAGDRLRAALHDFLRDHGPCAWRAAGMGAPPGQVAVVPSGQERPGPHPLASLVASCVKLPAVPLSARVPDAPRGREIGLGWLRVGSAVAGESVLVVDDTWVSGGSAQSVAVALKLAGAARVAVVVLGRHVDPADPRSASLMPALRGGTRGPGHECVHSGAQAIP
ncbi:MAG TPA: phosphoribosyltransferase [Trebonia sp.]|nr:phosphoribosyltransferase [Trebonia sp.]